MIQTKKRVDCLDSIVEFCSQVRTALSNEVDGDFDTARRIEMPSNWARLETLAKQFDLTKNQAFVLAVAAAFAFESELRTLAAVAQEDLSQQFLSIKLLMMLRPDEDDPVSILDLLDSENALVARQLVRIGNEPFTCQTLQPIEIERRVFNHLLGFDSIDERLKNFCRKFELGWNDELAQTENTKKPNLSLASGSHGVIGSTETCLATIRASLAQQHNLFIIDSRHLPERIDELNLLGSLLFRESKLGNSRFVLVRSEVEPERAKHLLLASRVSMFVASEDIHLVKSLVLNWSKLERPSRSRQLDYWNQYFDETTALNLVGQFDFEIHQISKVAQRHLATGEDPILLSHELNLPEFGRLAHRINCVASWKDIVVPATTENKLRAVCNQVKYRHQVLEQWGFSQKLNRGLGTAVLFHGESGTGKTMAAEVIANELRRELYRVDLSTVVDKYIGETEKNLSKIFDEAERSGCVLFFDEADALFGKRSEVSDARDRYANIEINYLLQRLEAFDGLTILATNVRRHLDKAFVRRFKYVIEFPFPDSKSRKEIWQRSIPESAPTGQIDFDHLSRISVSGGTIANAVINGAFSSAATSQPLDMGSLLTALRLEIEKLDQPINEIDFRCTSQLEGVA